ncbi:tRNA (adenosine(37)-N6)-threonylcarbamoyltransferase complex ATPase subunit type 1 TsaE [Candidatus Foliamicus sp.]
MRAAPSARTASFLASSPSALDALGRAMGEALIGALECRQTLVLGFDGELGSGKTTMIGAALRSLGVNSPVTSPTYGLVHPYAIDPSGLPHVLEVLHIDLYRLQRASELDELGLLDDLPTVPAANGKVLLVEWFANAGGRLGTADVALGLRHADRGRIVQAQVNSAQGVIVLAGLRRASHPDLASPDKK